MLREHQAMLRDPEMRRLYERALKAFAAMGAIMRTYMGG